MPGALAAWSLVLMALVFDPGSFDPESPKALVGVLGLILTWVAALRSGVEVHGTRDDLRPLAALLFFTGLALVSPFPYRATDFVVHLALVAGFHAAGRTGLLTLSAARLPLATGVVLVVALGLVLERTGFWARPDLRGGVEGTAFELVSGLTNPDYTGAWLMLTVPLMIHLRMRVVAAIAVAGMALTYSRFSWLALAGAMILHARHPVHRRRVVTGLLVLVAVLLLVGGRGLTKLFNTRTSLKRIHLYESCLTLIGRAPWIGHGPGSFGAVYPEARPEGVLEDAMNFQTDFAHDLPLQILVESGILGFLVLAWAAVPLGRWLYSEIRGPPAPDVARPTRRQIRVASTPLPDTPARALATSVTAFLIHNLISVSAFVTATAAFAGWTTGALAREKEDPAGRALPVARIAWIPLGVFLALLPGRWNFHHSLAVAGRAGADPGGLTALEEAVARVPGHAPLRYTLAGRLAAIEPDRAMKHYQALEAVEPSFARLHYNKAKLQLDRGRLDGVQEELEKQLRLQDTCYRSHYALAELAFLRGDRARAHEHLERCLALQPPPEVAAEARRILATLEPPR